MKAIYFDMDGTIADLYAVTNWLNSLENEHTKPYREAKSLVDMRELGKIINHLQNIGYHVGIVSWLSKCGSEKYNAKVIQYNWAPIAGGDKRLAEILKKLR